MARRIHNPNRHRSSWHNSNWVCFSCRVNVRRPSEHQDDVLCPECGAKLWQLGFRIEVPPHRDVRAWRQLQQAQLALFHANVDAASRLAVRERHDLEREIRRLQDKPRSRDRDKVIESLRDRLDGG